MLKPLGLDMTVSSIRERLSYGERNAFALILFTFEAAKENPDLIILDDPISSFDGNKKFAIINMLFFCKPSLRGKTVLLLTHEFNSIIDLVYVLNYRFTLKPKAAFLFIENNTLNEKSIEKNDIKSFEQIAHVNIKKDNDILNKVVYLRRLLEVKGKKGLAWNVLSNLVHKKRRMRNNGK